MLSGYKGPRLGSGVCRNCGHQNHEHREGVCPSKAVVGPRCPRCGEPPRVVVIRRARVRCQVLSDGSIGRVLSATTEREPEVLGYECGGRHEWEVDSRS